MGVDRISQTRILLGMDRLEEHHKYLISQQIKVIDRLWTAPPGSTLQRNLLARMESLDRRIAKIHRQIEIRLDRRAGRG